MPCKRLEPAIMSSYFASEESLLSNSVFNVVLSDRRLSFFGKVLAFIFSPVSKEFYLFVCFLLT